MKTFLEAVATMEGFYRTGSLAQRRHNPGNIEEGRFAQAHGAMASDGDRFAAFPSDIVGFAAARALFKSAYLGLTITAAIRKWAPAQDGNNVLAYIDGVCEMTGFTPDIVLTADNIG